MLLLLSAGGEFFLLPPCSIIPRERSESAVSQCPPPVFRVIVFSFMIMTDQRTAASGLPKKIQDNESCFGFRKET